MAVPMAVVCIVIALIMPMPAFLLDFLIVVDITLSVIVLLVSVYIRKAVDFNVFPTTLLLLTLYRLALNISSSRLILLRAADAWTVNFKTCPGRCDSSRRK